MRTNSPKIVNAALVSSSSLGTFSPSLESALQVAILTHFALQSQRLMLNR